MEEFARFVDLTYLGDAHSSTRTSATMNVRPRVETDGELMTTVGSSRKPLIRDFARLIDNAYSGDTRSCTRTSLTMNVHRHVNTDGRA